MNLWDCWPSPVEIIGSTAVEAMLMEAACAPAPGLVDRFNSGAHQDMDFFTFIKSSSALGPAMYYCANVGWQHTGSSQELLPVLRTIGQKAEKVMFAATNGINTQKGLLFLLGIMTAAAAKSLRGGYPNSIIEVTLKEAAQICAGIVERELKSLQCILPERKLTAGEQLFLNYGITGIRGEIEAGLPIVRNQGLPCLQEALEVGLTLNDALIHALIGIMCKAQDTTVLNRHNPSTLTEIQETARSILQAGGMLTDMGRKRIEELDKEYARRRISPGGSADLLAIVYFLYCLQQKCN
ncbi:triphosphoribosyl-dephospho-CoA synthase CitG [Sporomusaceae bacterium BoRhaA]|uniref:triphosphoribosyl-dephospho-CoA synthase CitG n=1 Tax=Pelorhabdus rhamnosifermentans TaxID=2772457 RepID=UPI001C0640D6|nr:triphosphoribosyl-dephospho-CoA synthase CitG [Pelorhabdus rhamnosifermentans]MBU2703985.1 triphosphoribosyl-dephospho-CoA synthase CitG [Pelorhabdus rhamnosifermentans]